MKFPKILVAAPQHESKKYCWNKWMKRVKSLTYPNYDVYLADNSPTNNFCEEIKKSGFACERVGYKLDSILERTTTAHESCRQYANSRGYDFLFHLETDVFPPIDVLERLLYNNKKVVSGIYDIFHGKTRKAMIQLSEKLDRTVRAYRVVPFLEHEEPLFFDGTLKQVYHAGIGCILIHRSVFEKIPFRFEKGHIFHADTWFANDCFQKDIPIFADTNILCKHLNKTWLDAADEILQPILEKNEQVRKITL